MRARSPIKLLMCSLLCACSPGYGQSALPVLEGPYLGQTPPGAVAEVFAPGVVSTRFFSYGGVFTPDMSAFYFLRDADADAETEFVEYRRRGNEWRASVLSGRVGQPAFSADGDVMHLGRRYKTRMEDGWSEPRDLGQPYADLQIMRMTSSAAGTWVFDEAGWPDGDGVLRYSRLADGVRQPPQAFGANINTGSFNAHPFIAPDESYLIWDGDRESGHGESDLYISFRQADGSWGEAINMGSAVNTDGWDAAASVTPGGRYLLFHRLNEFGNANIYWIDAAAVIEPLRQR